MALQCGLVGLPNVGKSTLFNAISGSGAAAENYPFCTIEPNRCVIPVPDERLIRLHAVSAAPEVIPTTVDFVDIAGLVSGASKGFGLGNAFLGHIRTVNAILHVVRCFEDADVVHVEGGLDARRDMEIINIELLLKDLESAEKAAEKAAKFAKSGQKDTLLHVKFADRVVEHLQAGQPARNLTCANEQETRWLGAMRLLSMRPVLYVANVAEADLPHGNAESQYVEQTAKAEGASSLVLSAEFEAQLLDFETAERTEWLASVGLKVSGLDRTIRAAYNLLGLITFFTFGPKQTRAWTVERGTKAPVAAGKIHTDFQRGFIRAETIAVEDLITFGSEAAARAAGMMRSEGKEYVVRDGDVILFRFNV